MAAVNHVYEKTYQNYISQVESVDFTAVALKLGAESYLDAECLAMLGRCLYTRLVEQAE